MIAPRDDSDLGSLCVDAVVVRIRRTHNVPVGTVIDEEVGRAKAVADGINVYWCFCEGKIGAVLPVLEDRYIVGEGRRLLVIDRIEEFHHGQS